MTDTRTPAEREADTVAAALVRRFCETGEGAVIRERGRLSLRAVAAVVGVSPQTLARWERGKTKPRGREAVAWVRFLIDLDAAVSSVEEVS